MLSVKQTARIISTYTGDTSGVCSALYELGGMTVMHDASGCNSTYNTHDEPRWYDFDSLVFISALTETQAILGDDNQLIEDTVQAARELSPEFIALAGTPVPMMTGVDFPAVARQIEMKTGILSFGFQTDGMHSYISGAAMAFEAVASRLCEDVKTGGSSSRLCKDVKTGGWSSRLCKDVKTGGSSSRLCGDTEAVSCFCADVYGQRCENTAAEDVTVNVLGVTPLDFSVNGTVEAMCEALRADGIGICSVWAMGSTLEDIKMSGRASVNLVVSACGLPAARVLKERFGIPYVVGAPCGQAFTKKITDALKRAAKTGKNEILCGAWAQKAAVMNGVSGSACADADGMSVSVCPEEKSGKKRQERTVIIGESVTALSLASALFLETGREALVLCAVDSFDELLSEKCIQAWDEDDIVPYLKDADCVIADPLYRPVCPGTARFVPLPHEAFSGRIYRKQIPQLVTGFKKFREENQL